MTALDACPHCGTSLNGEPIPVDKQDIFGGTHFRREIGIEVLGVYDGVLYWKCPDCDGAWHRWPDGSELRRRAEPYVTKGTPP